MINTRENISGANDDERSQKRKKYIKWGIIGAIIVIAVILAIVLPLTLKKGGGGGDDNGPVPQPPLTKQNPYTVDESKIVDNQVSITGILQTGDSSSRLFSKQSLFSELRDDPPTPPPTPVEANYSVNWTSQLKVDRNNQFVFGLNFTFEMLDYQIARFTLTDDDKERYSIPESVLNKPGVNPTMRLEMLGFQYNANPFSFSFRDVMDPTNVYVDTTGETLVFMDKYI